MRRSLQVLDFRAVRRWSVERRVGDLVVRDGDIEAIAEGCLEGILAHLLLLVGDVLALASFTHAVTLDGLGQDHCGLSCVFRRFRVGGVDLVGIVPAAVQAPDVLVGHVRHHLFQLGVLAEEKVASVFTALGLEGLVFAVDRLFHALSQQSLRCRAVAADPSTNPR